MNTKRLILTSLSLCLALSAALLLAMLLGGYAGSNRAFAASAAGLSISTASGIETMKPADITTGLVGYYPFNGNAADRSGNGNDGTVYGATLTSDRFNTPDSAYHFDGVDDYIEAGTDHFPFENASRTVAAWVRIYDKGPYPDRRGHPIIVYGTANSTNAYALTVDRADENCFDPYQWYWPAGSFTVAVSTWGAPNSVCTPPDLQNYPVVGFPFGSWHHLAATYDGTTHRIYVDGQLRKQASMSTWTAPGMFTIGGHDPRNQYTVYGEIDEVRVYNRALSHADILELINMPTVMLTVTVGVGPVGVGVNPNTNHIYITNFESAAVSVIDGFTNTVVATVTVGVQPVDVGVNPNTNRMYVANYGSGSVSVIDGGTNTVIETVPVGDGAHSVGINPTTNRIYVTNYFSQTVSVIDGGTITVVATVPIESGSYGIGVNPTTNQIYVANFNSANVSVIDGGTNNVIDTVPVGDHPIGIGINPTTNRIYVANHHAQTVSVIDGFTNTVVATVSVGNLPTRVSVNPNTNRIYVTNHYGDSVSVIDGDTNTVVSTVLLGNGDAPYGAGVNPNTNRIYVANRGGGGDGGGRTVSVIAYVADLSASMTNIRYATTITYTLVVSNTGPSGAGGAVVSDTFPGSITGVTWTCTEAGGATCGNANGTGHIQETVNLPFGGILTYIAVATLPGSLVGVINTATIAPPSGVTDPAPGNNETVNRSYALALPVVFSNCSP